MKLQLDTTNKTIKLESNVNINDLLKTLKKLFPNSEWQDFTLETHTTINNWNSPVIIREYPERVYPWYQTTWSSGNVTLSKSDITAGDNTIKSDAVMSLKTGIYNIEA